VNKFPFETSAHSALIPSLLTVQYVQFDSWKMMSRFETIGIESKIKLKALV